MGLLLSQIKDTEYAYNNIPFSVYIICSSKAKRKFNFANYLKIVGFALSL